VTKHLKKKRAYEIKQLVQAKLSTHLRDPHGWLNLQKPRLDKGMRELSVATKGKPIIKFGDPPEGIIFKDNSFLIIAEAWSETGELLSFSYHYQRPDPARWRFFRYDRERPEPPPVDKPRHHLHVCSELHYATGPVELGHVLDVIAELFRRQAEGEEVL
jgi:hypothetical protein